MFEKICKICNKRIYPKKENWCCIIDYEKEIETKKGYYHRNCFMERFRQKVIEAAKSIAKHIQVPA